MGCYFTESFSRMAENAKTQLSIEGIFRVLASIPENQLLKFKYKLNCARQDRRTCQLLQAMILLRLRQEMEARVSLAALGEDATAAHIYRSHMGGAKANSTNSFSPKQDAAVAVAVARIYSLLVDEQLCDPQARVEAYRAAIRAAQVSNSVQACLIDEAQSKCGLDFTEVDNDFSALRSVAGKFTVPRSFPLPTKNVSVPPDPQPLRSTDTLDSFISHLEISQSPTVPLLTSSVHQPGLYESSKLCESASSQLMETSKREASVRLPATCLTESPASAQDEPKSSLLGSPELKAELPLEERVNHPTECTEPPSTVAVGLQDPEGSTPPKVHISSTLQPGSATQECISTPIEDSGFPTQGTDSGPFTLDSPISPSPLLLTGSLSTDPQYDERQFFTFVVLHAGEDESIACRVKDRLEDMGVSNGATFSEDFLVPGRCQLSCFQNALDNSAFTLLLLTENFKCRICSYQTNVALMDSFSRFLKTNSVIPFVPKENPIKRGEMPTLLSAIVALDENSPVFARKVKKTFSPKEIKDKRRVWKDMQEIRNRERLQEQYQNYQLMAQRLSEVNIAGCPTQMPFPLPQRSFPGLQHGPPGYIPEPLFQPTFPAPGMPQPQPVPTQPCLSQAFRVSLGPPNLMQWAPQPQLIIQNAQMVQIGDYNQMQVERTNAALHTTDSEVDRNQVLEGENAGERKEE